MSHAARVAIVAVLVSVASIVAACGHSNAKVSPAAAFERKVAAALDPLLAPSGLRVSRAELKANAGTGEFDVTGSHFAVYVAPITATTPESYVSTLATVVHVTVPYGFRSYPKVQSLDVCQEPFGDPRKEPPPKTQLVLTREQFGRTDWDTIGLSDIVRGAAATPNVAALFVSPDVRSTPAWAAAMAG